MSEIRPVLAEIKVFSAVTTRVRTCPHVNSQKRLGNKENNAKYRSLTRKPRSHARISWYIERGLFNGPFPSSPMPLFQNESKCETFHMKMSSVCSFIFMQIKVIFIRMVSHLDSLRNRGTREFGNGLLRRQLDFRERLLLFSYYRRNRKICSALKYLI